MRRDRLELVSGELSAEAGGSRCVSCQSLLWAEHPQFGSGIKFLRVGTLDEAEQLAPDAHFFVRSKHPWVVIPDGVRAFEALPGADDPPLLSNEAAARVDAARR